jgi:hypothetical protein
MDESLSRKPRSKVGEQFAKVHCKRISMTGYGEHWNGLTLKERRIAEESAIDNWDNPELLDFSKNLNKVAQLRKHLLSEWTSFKCPSSAKTGVVVSVNQIESLFGAAESAEADTSSAAAILWEFHRRYLFRSKEYCHYVLKVANEICLSPTNGTLAVAALRDTVIPFFLAKGFPKRLAKQLSCVCKALQRSYIRHFPN